jgi:hypothetical protein
VRARDIDLEYSLYSDHATANYLSIAGTENQYLEAVLIGGPIALVLFVKGYLHKYSIADSIQDGTTLPFYYNLAPNHMVVPHGLQSALNATHGYLFRGIRKP